MASNTEPSTAKYSQLQVDAQGFREETQPKFADLRESNQKFTDLREPNQKLTVADSDPPLPEDKDGLVGPSSQHRSFWRRKWVWLVVAVLVIAAVVGGAIGGTVGKSSNSKTSPTNTSSTSPPTRTSTPIPTMSGSATALSNYLYPTALSWGYPHLEALVLGPSNHSVYWKYRAENATSTEAWDPQDSSLALVGGQVANFEKGIAAVTRSPMDVDIFVVGIDITNNGLFHKYHTRSMLWNPVKDDGWESFTVSLASGPEVVSWAEDRLDVFAIGDAPDYTLLQLTWDANGWAPLNNLGGTWSTFAPTAVSWGEGRIDLFTVNPITKALNHKYWDGSTWQPPNSFDVIGGYCASRPVAVSWGAGRIDLFVRGGDAGLWHMSYSANIFSNWTSISGNSTIQGEPDAVSWGTNRIDVFAWGSDGTLLHKSYDGTKGAWSPSDGFESIGKGLTGPPKSVSDGVGSVHVFAYTQGAELVHKAWNQTVGHWTPSNDFEALGTP